MKVPSITTIPIILEQQDMHTRPINKTLFPHLCACWFSLLFVAIPTAAEEFPQGIHGDIGFGGYYTRSIIRGKSDAISALPYADFEYGRMFARVDTLGIKTLKMGNGHLELVGRISQDGFNTNESDLLGIGKRETSIPLGIGTLQVTKLGGFMVNAFHDVRKSRGNWFEVIYAGEFDFNRVAFYPLLGAEYQSKEYVRYYYGISPLEAVNSQYPAYQPAGSFNQLIGLIADVRLTDEYHLNCYVRRKWLGDAIRYSPIVSQSYLDTGYVALSYRFK